MNAIVQNLSAILAVIALTFSGLFFMIDAKAGGPIQEAMNLAQDNKQEIADVWKYLDNQQQRSDKKEEVMMTTLGEILGRVSRIEGLLQEKYNK